MNLNTSWINTFTTETFSSLNESNSLTSNLKFSTSKSSNDHSIPKQEIQVDGLISDLALILVFGALITVLFKKLKQPIVLGYIVAGFLVGPHFLLVPSVTNEANIEFWAQIGIIVLLFSLGLEFNIRRLINVGGSAIITAFIIISGMMGLGFIAGKIMGFTSINSLFLGSMLSMSSTTIIIKALTDLHMKQRRFVPMVFAVLICEDLFAVIMMVMLSSIVINNTLEGAELIYSIIKLIFFLIIWFVVGVFVLPSFFRYFRNIINDEILLVLAMGLCLLMAIFSVYSGFSLALGAFVMGSILAGTCEAEHIERVTKPVKDLFGAVFFISVGMMVNPIIIATNILPILLLSCIVIVGMISFGSFGMLLTGQSLKIALETGFSLTQIGEFAFIIAALGMSLGVLDPVIYPIIVAVSVITIFFTPYFIKLAIPTYNWIEKRLPPKWHFLINRYAKEATEESENKILWKEVAQRYIWRIIFYSTFIIAIMAMSYIYLLPLLTSLWGAWGRFTATVIAFIAMAPFLFALSYPSITKGQKQRLEKISDGRSKVPIVVMLLIRISIAFGLILGFLTKIYSHAISLSVGVCAFFLLIVVLSKTIRKKVIYIEEKFMNNLNEREIRKRGKDNNIISDLHVAYMTVGYDCPFVGERLGNSNIRKEYGVNVVSIKRGGNIIPIPQSHNRIFPGDLLGIIGTDKQIERLLPIMELGGTSTDTLYDKDKTEIKFTHLEIYSDSVLIGQSTASIKLRDIYSALLVAIQRNNKYITPTGSETFQAGDILWIVGDIKKIETLK